MHELVYTSAPKGLKPGSQGFCTVACSAGMPPNLMMRLEALSAGRPLTPSARNGLQGHPVVLSHLILRVGGINWHVLSRIADAGVDYTQRSNKIAHHVVLDALELPPAGPAALLACEGRFFCTWDGEPKVITKPAPFPAIKSSPKPCLQWEHETGDAGWGGVLAEAACDGQTVHLIARPETRVIALFEEALALLSPEVRWQTTLTTYYTRFSSGVDCRWRCIVGGSSDVTQLAGTPDVMVIDLTQPLKTPVPRPLVKAARSGRTPAELLDVGNIVGFSTAVDVDRRRETSAVDQMSDCAISSQDGAKIVSKGVPPKINDADETVRNVVKLVPERKRRKTKSKRNSESTDKFFENRQQWLESTKKSDEYGLLALLGLGFVFFVVPILLFVALYSIKGNNDSAEQDKPSNEPIETVQNSETVTPKSDTLDDGKSNAAPLTNEPSKQESMSTAETNASEKPSDGDHVKRNNIEQSDVGHDDRNDVDETKSAPVLQGQKLHIDMQRHGRQSLVEAKQVSGTNVGGFDGDVPIQLFDLAKVANETTTDRLLLALGTSKLNWDQTFFVRMENAAKQEHSKRVEVYLKIGYSQANEQTGCVFAFELTPNRQGIDIARPKYRLFDEMIGSLKQASLGVKGRSVLSDISLPMSSEISELEKLAWLDEQVDDKTRMANIENMRNDTTLDATTRQQVERLAVLLNCHAEFFSGQSNGAVTAKSLCIAFDYDVYEKRPGDVTEIVHVVTSQTDEEYEEAE